MAVQPKGVRVFWSYTNRFTEANAGGGNNTVTITPAANTAIRLNYAGITMCNAAAGRATTARIYNEDGTSVVYLGSISMDDQSMRLPSIGASATTADNMANSQNIIIPGDGSSFVVVAAALANTEFFDLLCCFELYGTTTAPTVAHTSSGTASTGTASQNEVTVVPVFA